MRWSSSAGASGPAWRVPAALLALAGAAGLGVVAGLSSGPEAGPGRPPVGPTGQAIVTPQPATGQRQGAAVPAGLQADVAAAAAAPSVSRGRAPPGVPTPLTDRARAVASAEVLVMLAEPAAPPLVGTSARRGTPPRPGLDRAIAAAADKAAREAGR